MKLNGEIMREFKLSEATHVCMHEDGAEDYTCDGVWFHDFEGFSSDRDLVRAEPFDTPITDLCPEPYTGGPAEKRLDDLKRDLNAHGSDEVMSAFAFDGLYFGVNPDGSIVYLREKDLPHYNWTRHPMPTHRGTVSQDAKDPKNRELAGIEPLSGTIWIANDSELTTRSKIMVEEMIKHDQLNREGFDASLVSACPTSVIPWVKYSEWDGEGLPPVGVECEMSVVHEGVESEYMRGTVEFASMDAVVFRNHPKVVIALSSPKVWMFRPLRTERERAIDEANKILSNGKHDWLVTVGELIDALGAGKIPGYGKLSEEK